MVNLHIKEEEVMMRKTRWNPVEWSRNYFEYDEVEKQYLQHVTFERIQEIRHTYLVDMEIEMSLTDVMSEQLHIWEKKEEYGMCQIIKDTARLYEIDLY